LQGGEEGAAGQAIVTRAATGQETALPGKCSRKLAKGDILRLETPGGGGWGEA
jgi:N-methylhydantoinase B